MEEIKRKCPECGRTLGLEEFSPNKNSSDGLSKICKDCLRKKHSQAKKELANPLAKYTPRDLMEELRRRGYRGNLEFTEVHRINLETM